MIAEQAGVDLARVRVVLVETSHPGNIGATARAMKTMGLTRLVLVNPKDYPSNEATARASGADDVLYRAQVVDGLAAALTGCRMVVGVSARRRGIASSELDPRGCVTALARLPAAETALLFGRERSGLSNDELDRCQMVVRIPANPEYSSLNLAAAVQILAYELRLQAGGQSGVEEEQPPAPFEEQERFYQHLQETLLAVGFLNPANPRHLMRRLRRLFNRARPDQREINILRGILSAVQERR